ncbi:hypothetical protein T4C_214 [Trichinella pseudospiralis]|uniref:Uncharacterized protein n=1 Tax=Trichinella pseudospiralis TaxID=6337 RepID=A0A0V1JEF8_TRIPS|nr:hypothetical protein T4C_214 [Trichinella pseudospiralis]
MPRKHNNWNKWLKTRREKATTGVEKVKLMTKAKDDYLKKKKKDDNWCVCNGRFHAVGSQFEATSLNKLPN